MTEEKTFEEQFPSFKIEYHPEASMIFNDKFLRSYIMKRCLDKQNVREAIERCRLSIKDKAYDFMIKELEL